jgi:hypothetical protein
MHLLDGFSQKQAPDPGRTRGLPHTCILRHVPFSPEKDFTAFQGSAPFVNGQCPNACLKGLSNWPEKPFGRRNRWLLRR